MTLKEFIEEYNTGITEKIKESLRPVYDPTQDDPTVEEYEQLIKNLVRKPFPVQAEIIKGISKSLYKEGRKRLFVSGEMGTGKTFLGLSVIHMSSRALRALVVAPGHLVEKWIREAKITIPGVQTVDLAVRHPLRKLNELRNAGRPKRPEIWVISKERLKLGSGWRACYNVKQKKDYKGSVVSYIVCPSCFKRPGIKKDEDYEYLTKTALMKKRHFCDRCGSALWEMTPKPRRYAPAEYIKKYLKGKFDMVILDEIHDYKAGNTLQGNAMGTLVSSSEYFLGLTGTLNGGYADNLFYLLFRLEPYRLKSDGFTYHSAGRWQEQFGVIEHITTVDDDIDNVYGRRRKSNRAVVKKAPGVAPECIGRYLLDKSVFIRLQDVIDGLPPYEEYVLSVEMAEGEYHTQYIALENRLRRAVKEHGLKAAGSMIQALLSYPDSCICYPEEIVIADREWNPETRKREIVRIKDTITAPLLDGRKILPKEKELLRICEEERKEGRKVLLYLTFTGKRDIRPRLIKVLESKNFRVKVLPETVEPKRRERWIEEHGHEADVLITNPELVKVGLDLIQFPTIVFYQTGYNIFTLRQAARRSWRIGQPRPVKVYYLCYQRTMQEAALHLIASKLEEALLVEGDLPEGLARLNLGGGSMLEEMVKALVSEQRYSGAETAWANLRKKEIEVDLGLTSNTTIFKERSLERVDKGQSEKASIIDNTLIKVTIREGKRKKTSRMEVRYGDLESIAKDKIVQFALF